MRVEVLHEVPDDVIEEFYGLYRAAFEPLRTLAAARQVLTAAEFVEEMADDRVEKYVVYDAGGRAVALSTLATDLSAVPWIEPAYFAARYPEHAARGALFYLGFTLVHPDHQSSRVFSLSIAAIIRRLAEARAVVAYDICAHNDTVRQLGAGLERAQTAKADVTVTTVDAQTYYLAQYHGTRIRLSAA
jgi:hypothetical protein